MSSETKKTVSFLIKQLKEKINSPDPKNHLEQYPNYQEDTKITGKIEIDNHLKKLKGRHKELLPFVKLIKREVSNITDTKIVSAVYLLLCYNFQTWESLFLLSKKGQYSSIMTLIRKLKETSMLIQHFVLENRAGKNRDLKKWFSGEVITHSKGRESSSRFAEEDGLFPDLDWKRMEAHIYQMESLTPHASYVSVLECINVFEEDFDFKGFAGYRRTISALRYANGTMTNINITLKGVYRFLLEDHANYDKLDAILLKYDPEIASQTLDLEIQKQFKK